MPDWKRMQHILWVPLFEPGGTGRATSAVPWQKIQSFGSCLQDSLLLLRSALYTEISRLHSLKTCWLGTWLPWTLRISLNTSSWVLADFPFHLAWLTVTLDPWRCKEKPAQGFQNSVMGTQTLFQLLCSFVFSEEMESGTGMKLPSHFIRLLREDSFSLRHSQLAVPRFCRNCAHIVPLWPGIAVLR